jgi:DinB family protein
MGGSLTLITVRIESPAFTEREMRAFQGEVIDHERQRLADRLEADSARLSSLAPTLTLPRERGREKTQGWSAQEILAHIAVLSKFYGVLTSRVGSGKVSQIELLEAVQARDPAGEQLSSLPPDQLLAMVQRDHQRTIAYLRGADADAMQRRAVLYEGFSMSAAEIAQLPLCAHLEIHLDQLERTLRH